MTYKDDGITMINYETKSNGWYTVLIKTFSIKNE